MYICLEEEEEYFFIYFSSLAPLAFPLFSILKFKRKGEKMESARRPKGIVSERAHAG
jgi:hypothetical protein